MTIDWDVILAAWSFLASFLIIFTPVMLIVIAAFLGTRCALRAWWRS